MAEETPEISEEDLPFVQLGQAVDYLTRYVDANPEVDCIEFHGTVNGKAIVRTIIVQEIDIDSD